MTHPEHRAGISARLDELTGPETSDAGRALLSRLLRSYVTKTPPGLAQLSARWREGDVPGVRDQAHALKGSASNLGVTAMSTLCGGIEEQARAGHLPDEATLDALTTTFAEVAPVCTSLAEELDG